MLFHRVHVYMHKDGVYSSPSTIAYGEEMAVETFFAEVSIFPF